MRLPPLTLQLLVENAIKHNTATTADPLVITVTARAGTVIVGNAIRPRGTASRSTGFGLQSIRQRFAALTDRPMEVVNDGGTFTVRIPLIAP
jgi:LytS/YehU family sensor histidine kinase